MNSNIAQNWIGEFSFGIHKQRNNVIPDAAVANTALINDTFAILRANGTVAPVTHTDFPGRRHPDDGPDPAALTPVSWIMSIRRAAHCRETSSRTDSACSRIRPVIVGKLAARFQNILESATRSNTVLSSIANNYDINQTSTGPSGTFSLTRCSSALHNGSNPDNITVSGYRVDQQLVGLHHPRNADRLPGNSGRQRRE